MEYKPLDLRYGAFKDVDTRSGIVTGHLAYFDNVDSYGDVITKGAFKKTITENGPTGKARIPYIFNHDLTIPLGKMLKLEEDSKGLYFEAQMSKATEAQEKLLMIEEGILNENSIGYDTIIEDKADGVRYLKEIKLWEGSLVTIAANDKAKILGVKNIHGADLYKAVYTRMNQLSKFLKNAKIMTDNTAASLQEELSTLGQLLKQASDTYEQIKKDQEEMKEAFDKLKQKMTDDSADDKSQDETDAEQSTKSEDEEIVDELIMAIQEMED